MTMKIVVLDFFKKIKSNLFEVQNKVYIFPNPALGTIILYLQGIVGTFRILIRRCNNSFEGGENFEKVFCIYN